MRHMMNWTPAVLLILSACTVHKVNEEIKVPEVVPESYSHAGEAPHIDQWWKSFDDQTVDLLVGRVLQQNLDLRASWARLRQAEAIAVQAGAARLPSVNLNASASSRDTVFAGQRFTQETYSLNAGFSWQVDLWNRLSSAERAASWDYAAARDDVEATALALSGSVVDLWFSVIEQRAVLHLLEAQIEANDKLLEILETRFNQGATNAVSVLQQREQVMALQAQIPTAESRLALLEHQLSVLLGRAPGQGLPGSKHDLPHLPELPATGVPIDLLKNRPDVRKAWAAVVAADYRVGVAVADRYPSLSLSGSGGFTAEDIGDLFSDFLWDIAAQLTAPLFDGGRRRAEVHRTEAVLDVALANYEKTVLTALREVEDALIQEQKQQEYLEQIGKKLDLSRLAYDSSMSRFSEGVGDFLTLLTQNQSVLRAEQDLVNGQKNLLSARIDLYQALGGTWTSELEAPKMEDAE